MPQKEKVITDELKVWLDEKLINHELYEILSAKYRTVSWDILTIIRWSLIIGAIMLGVGIILLVSLIFKSMGFVVLTLSVLCGVGFYYGFGLTAKDARHAYPKSGNALIAIACLLLCGDIFAIANLISSGTGNWPNLLLIAVGIYFVIAYLKKNSLVLVMALIGLASWYGTESGYVSGWGAYFLGLNYPVRFAIASPLVISIGYLHQKYLKDSEPFVKIYYSFGLLYLNLSLWILSIFGAYGAMSAWQEARHPELLLFSIIWGLASVGSLIIGVKYYHKMFVNYAIVFLIINLYTRYFEYFWDQMDKSLFFIILGGVSVAIGVYFERKLKLKKIRMIGE